MKKILYLAFTLLVALAGTACSESVSSTPRQTSHDVDRHDDKHSMIAYGTPDHVLSISPETSDKLATEFAERRASVLQIIESDEPLPHRDRRVRAFLYETDGLALSHYVRQFAAVRLLRELLESSESSGMDAIDYYTSLLEENASPEAPLILQALKRLEKRWAPERLSEVSRLSAERAIVWAERVCGKCREAKSAGRIPDYDDERIARKVAELTSAAAQLVEMASP
jgi:hypothetical protein